VLQITRVREYLAGLDRHIEIERSVSRRLYLDVMLSRRQVQRAAGIVELIDNACVGGVDCDGSVTGRDRKAHTAVPRTGNERQRPYWISPVVPRVVERIAEGVSKEHPEADAESWTERESGSKPTVKMASIESVVIKSVAVSVVVHVTTAETSSATMEFATVESTSTTTVESPATTVESTTAATAVASGLNRHSGVHQRRK
jgi:hypothetical protein